MRTIRFWWIKLQFKMLEKANKIFEKLWKARAAAIERDLRKLERIKP